MSATVLSRRIVNGGEIAGFNARRVRVVEISFGGSVYTLRIAREIYRPKKWFELYKDHVRQYVGSGYWSADNIERIVIEAIEGQAPVANISIDKNGTVAVSYSRGIK